MSYLPLYQAFSTLSVFTDHKPLCCSLLNNSDRYTHVKSDIISQFTSDIQHIKGSNNPVTNALSRVDSMEMNLLDAPLTIIEYFEQIASLHEKCNSFSKSFPTIYSHFRLTLYLILHIQ